VLQQGPVPSRPTPLIPTCCTAHICTLTALLPSCCCWCRGGSPRPTSRGCQAHCCQHSSHLLLHQLLHGGLHTLPQPCCTLLASPVTCCCWRAASTQPCLAPAGAGGACGGGGPHAAGPTTCSQQLLCQHLQQQLIHVALLHTWCRQRALLPCMLLLLWLPSATSTCAAALPSHSSSRLWLLSQPGGQRGRRLRQLHHSCKLAPDRSRAPYRWHPPSG
jgi:hypothetical protein